MIPAQSTDFELDNSFIGMLWTMFVMIASAWLGAIIGAAVVSTPLITAAFLAGPIGWLFAVPMAMAQAALAYMGTFIVPLWAFLGGTFFAVRAASNAVHTDDIHGLTLFSDTHPIHEQTAKFAAKLNLPPIKWVGWFEDDSINAFAMGLKQEDALIAFSRGAVERLTEEELDAVLAHELAHVANNDMSRMTYAYGVRDALTWFLYFKNLKKIARWFFTPLSEMELLRFSRCREFAADKTAANLTSNQAMIQALRAIQHDTKPSNSKLLAEISHFALSNPFKGLFSTHPPIEKRIKALSEASDFATSDRLPSANKQRKQT